MFNWALKNNTLWTLSYLFYHSVHFYRLKSLQKMVFLRIESTKNSLSIWASCPESCKWKYGFVCVLGSETIGSHEHTWVLFAGYRRPQFCTLFAYGSWYIDIRNELHARWFWWRFIKIIVVSCKWWRKGTKIFYIRAW